MARNPLKLAPAMSQIQSQSSQSQGPYRVVIFNVTPGPDWPTVSSAMTTGGIRLSNYWTVEPYTWIAEYQDEDSAIRVYSEINCESTCPHRPVQIRASLDFIPSADYRLACSVVVSSAPQGMSTQDFKSFLDPLFGPSQTCSAYDRSGCYMLIYGTPALAQKAASQMSIPNSWSRATLMVESIQITYAPYSALARYSRPYSEAALESPFHKRLRVPHRERRQIEDIEQYHSKGLMLSPSQTRTLATKTGVNHSLSFANPDQYLHTRQSEYSNAAIGPTLGTYHARRCIEIDNWDASFDPQTLEAMLREVTPYIASQRRGRFFLVQYATMNAAQWAALRFNTTEAQAKLISDLTMFGDTDTSC